jgi:hypothetical protein
MIKIALGVYGTLEITIGKAHRLMKCGGERRMIDKQRR